MSTDHEEWLRKQGVRITGRHTLRRAKLPSYYEWIDQKQNDPIDWAPETEQVYQVEIDERTVERLRRSDLMITNAIEHAARLNRQGIVTSSSIGHYVVENYNRHHELVRDNEMYRTAWKEFQSIRALLGETPHWP